MSYMQFVAILRDEYKIEVDMFWQEQFAKWQRGERKGLKPQTLAILGGV